MKSRKTSYSLSKLNLKKHYGEKSQRSSDKDRSKRTNLSQIESLGIDVLNLGESRQAVYNEYYQTDVYKMANDHKHRQLEKNSKEKRNVKYISEIEEKMRRVMESEEYESEQNVDNIVIEESDGDEDFEQKILKNKALLKMQREKNISSQSQQTLHKQLFTDSKKSSAKNNGNEKSLLIKPKIGQKPLRKFKSKSLFPPINNSLSSKILSGFEQKRHQNRLINQNDKKLVKISNNHLEEYLKKDQIVIPKNQTIHQAKKQDLLKRKMTEFSKNKLQNNKQERKLTELKLESKIEHLKGRLAQRTSGKASKNEAANNNKEAQINRIARYSSHSIFDNIQQFLSNPHENNSKSKRKFLKLYEKIDQNSKIHKKQSEKIKQRIKKMQQKIKNIEILNTQQHSPAINLNNNHSTAQQQYFANTSNNSNPNPPQKPHKPTHQTQNASHAQQSLVSDTSNLKWFRIQKDTLQKSDFQKQLKHILTLEQKGNQIIKKYIENQKILHELKLVKKSQQIVQKKLKKDKGSADNYTSL